MFGKRDENREVGPHWERHSFDEVARGLASGDVSRDRAVKLIGMVILGAALVPFLPSVAEAAPRCPRKGPGCNSVCRDLKKGQRCVCVETTEGESVCVVPACKEQICLSSEDCPGDLVCSTTAQKCCATPGPGKPLTPFCVQKCR